MAESIRILVACHRPCEVPQDPMYLPVQVGAAGKEPIGFARDDEGIEISRKNPEYCELTALYWGWKNLSCGVLGLVQYRRCFTMHGSRWCRRHGLSESALSSAEAQQLMASCRVLVPSRRHYYIETIYSQYAHTFDGSQLDKARQVLVQTQPDYVRDFDEFMRRRSGYMFNLFLMERPLLDAYCTWLFGVLSELEKLVDTAGMTDFERRYAGRVSERLFNVWLIHQQRIGALKPQEIRECRYFYSGRIDWGRKIGAFLAAKVFHRKYRRSF